MIKKLLLISAALLYFYIPIAAIAYDDKRTHPGRKTRVTS